MNYEELLDTADQLDLAVKEQPLTVHDGLIRGRRIAIRKSIETQAEKSCVLAEERQSLQEELNRVLTPAAPPETISKEDFRKEIKNINDILKNPEEPTEKKGLLLRSIVDRIVYEKSSGTMYFDFFVS